MTPSDVMRTDALQRFAQLSVSPREIRDKSATRSAHLAAERSSGAPPQLAQALPSAHALRRSVSCRGDVEPFSAHRFPRIGEAHRRTVPCATDRSRGRHRPGGGQSLDQQSHLRVGRPGRSDTAPPGSLGASWRGRRGSHPHGGRTDTLHMARDLHRLPRCR